LTTNLGAPAGDATDYPLPSVVRSSAPIVFEPKFVGGIEFGTGFVWGLLGESNGIDIAGSTNFRLRF
jgi:hypothetical protein